MDGFGDDDPSRNDGGSGESPDTWLGGTGKHATRTWEGSMAASKQDADMPRRVGDYTPEVEPSPTLEDAGIEGQDVTIAEVEFHERDGEKGPYTLTIVTLDDGARFHTGSSIVAERLRAIPESDFPVVANFTRVKSKKNARQSYWMVR